MTNLFTRIFNPRYAETFRQSEGRLLRLNGLVCEGWNFLSGRKVADDELPKLNWTENQDGSVSCNWRSEKYASYRYTINRSSVICSQFPDEDLDLEWGSDLGLAMEHLHMLATTVVDDVWPFVLTKEERGALNNHVAQLINSFVRESGLEVDVLFTDADEEEKDLSEDEVADIQSVAGGKEAYKELLSWANDRLPKKEIDAFDEVVSHGNRESISAAVRGLMQQRLDAQAVGQG